MDTYVESCWQGGWLCPFVYPLPQGYCLQPPLLEAMGCHPLCTCLMWICPLLLTLPEQRGLAAPHAQQQQPGVASIPGRRAGGSRAGGSSCRRGVTPQHVQQLCQHGAGMPAAAAAAAAVAAAGAAGAAALAAAAATRTPACACSSAGQDSALGSHRPGAAAAAGWQLPRQQAHQQQPLRRSGRGAGTWNMHAADSSHQRCCCRRSNAGQGVCGAFRAAWPARPAWRRQLQQQPGTARCSRRQAYGRGLRQSNRAVCGVSSHSAKQQR